MIFTVNHICCGSHRWAGVIRSGQGRRGELTMELLSRRHRGGGHNLMAGQQFCKLVNTIKEAGGKQIDKLRQQTFVEQSSKPQR